MQRAAAEAKAARTKRNIILAIVGAVLALFLLIGGCNSYTSVQAGHKAVVKSFGRTTGDVLEPGFSWLLPWHTTVDVNLQLTEFKEDMSVPTSTGTPVKIDVSSWSRISPSNADLINVVNNIGPDVHSFISSAKLAVVRNVIAGHSYEELCSNARENMNEEMRRGMTNLVQGKGIIVEQMLLLGIDPPQALKDAMLNKLAQQQAAEGMKFVLEKEKLDAERKVIEAGGIADSNAKIAHTLTPEYLQWYYVKALEGLAHSTNTTFIIAPTDTKLTPMLPLGTGK